jgi:hypothetical protein
VPLLSLQAHRVESPRLLIFFLSERSPELSDIKKSSQAFTLALSVEPTRALRHCHPMHSRYALSLTNT